MASPETAEMTEKQLSATDAALRERITELSVHIPCGRLRGPVQRRGRWQSCPDEDSPERWEGCDVSSARDLCIVCFRDTAGGTSRWAWLGCENCRAVNEGLGKPLALGRHSLMNGIGVSGNASPVVVEQQTARLLAFAKGDGRLKEWRRNEYGRLAAEIRSPRRHSAAGLATAMATQPSRVGRRLLTLARSVSPEGGSR